MIFDFQTILFFIILFLTLIWVVGRFYLKKKSRNFIAKDLFSRKYRKRVIKPKKGKGSFKRKKK